jgi:hypothetical protein
MMLYWCVDSVYGVRKMLTYLLGPLFGLEPGPIAFGLGTLECAIFLIAIKPISDRLFFAR